MAASVLSMGKSLRLGRVFGIPIEINVTWLVIFLLLTVLLADRFDSLRWPVYQQWIVAVITVVLFFLSVLAHELSHSLVALSRGIRGHGHHAVHLWRRLAPRQRTQAPVRGVPDFRGGPCDQPCPRRDCWRDSGLG